jgi:pyruvate dehydrogenase E1 component alpha subunit
MDLTTTVPDVAQRASAYNMPGIVVDGQDVGAVRSVVAEALERARGGRGPSLIEAKTYRFVGHSRADQARYRPAGELERWLERDPVNLLAEQITPGSGGDLARELRARCEAAIAEVIERVLAAAAPTTADLFRHVYAAPEDQPD